MSTITPQEYNEIIGSLKPVFVCLAECDFSSQSPHAGPLETEAFANPARHLEHTGDVDVARHLVTQEVLFSILDQESTKIAEGKCRFVVHFDIEVKPTPSFWKVFLQRNMPLYINPAARDVISALCMRASLYASVLTAIPVIAGMPIPPQDDVTGDQLKEPIKKKVRPRVRSTAIEKEGD